MKDIRLLFIILLGKEDCDTFQQSTLRKLRSKISYDKCKALKGRPKIILSLGVINNNLLIFSIIGNLHSFEYS
jgi:hypothetical protein